MGAEGATIMSLAVALGLDATALQNGLKNAESQSKGSGDKINDSLGLKGAQKGLDDTAHSAGGLGGAFGALIADMIPTITIAGALAEGMKLVDESIRAAADDETALSRLNMTIQSTGRFGETSAAQLDKMAASPLFDDAEINSAANALAKFIDIPSSQLGPDLVIIENMAGSFGGLEGAAEAFGMAMETGRTRGMGFSKEITNQINLLMTAGQVTQAQAIIVGQLSQRYSGQASAAMDTYNGKQQAVNTSMEEFRATVGNSFLPAGKIILDWENTFITTTNLAMTDWKTFGLEFGAASLFLINPAASVQLYQQAADGAKKSQEDLNNEVANATPTWNHYVWTITQGSDDINIAHNAMAALIEKNLKDIQKADDDLRKSIIDKDSWEVMYTNAKDTTERTKMQFDLLQQGIQAMGSDGASVWDAFLMASGDLDKPALMAFARVQTALSVIKGMIDQKMSLDVIVNFIQTGYAATGSVYGTTQIPQTTEPLGGGGGALGGSANTTAPAGGYTVQGTDSPTGIWYVDAKGWSPYGYKAGGGRVNPGGWAMVGEVQSEMIHARPGGGVDVFNQSQMGSIPGLSRIQPQDGAGGQVVKSNTFNISIVARDEPAVDVLSRRLDAMAWCGVWDE